MYSTTATAHADIAFENFLQAALSGFRGVPPEPGEQFVLRDEEFDIHVKIRGGEDIVEIHGQLLPRGSNEFAQRAECHILRHGARVQSTNTDETGEFHFYKVPSGNLTLQIDLPDLTIVGSLNAQDNEP